MKVHPMILMHGNPEWTPRGEILLSMLEQSGIDLAPFAWQININTLTHAKTVVAHVRAEAERWQMMPGTLVSLNYEPQDHRHDWNGRNAMLLTAGTMAMLELGLKPVLYGKPWLRYGNRIELNAEDRKIFADYAELLTLIGHWSPSWYMVRARTPEERQRIQQWNAACVEHGRQAHGLDAIPFVWLQLHDGALMSEDDIVAMAESAAAAKVSQVVFWGWPRTVNDAAQTALGIRPLARALADLPGDPVDPNIPQAGEVV